MAVCRQAVTVSRVGLFVATGFAFKYGVACFAAKTQLAFRLGLLFMDWLSFAGRAK